MTNESELDPIIDIQGEATKVSDCFQPTPKKPLLSIDQIRRIGAMQIEDLRDYEIDTFLAQQKNEYDHYAKEELVEELLRRDKRHCLEGRQLADGRTAGRLLREFVRGLLHTADHATLKQIGDDSSKAGQIEIILKALGAEPGDARQLRLRGHMLGGDAPSSEVEAMEKLAEQVPTSPRPDVADRILEQIARQRKLIKDQK